MDTQIAAIFDLDGTLYTGHIIHGIALHHRTFRVKRWQLDFFMASHMALYPLYRVGVISEATIREVWARHLSWTIAGWAPDEAKRAFAWITEHYVQPLIRMDVVERLREHQEQGHRVIIVSGTLGPLLAEIGKQLEVHETIGTPLVTRNGRYTGAVELPVCQGANKVRRLEQHLMGTTEILWDQSYSYADSMVDLPLLEHVGNPVVVYPDSQLTAHAKEQGWEIIN
ncbi:MAG TPA: HAD-IB family hydrolase [Bellilinea sp.]|nr:HAD-IB family hydrolase [Bellilinea sp.]